MNGEGNNPDFNCSYESAEGLFKNIIHFLHTETPVNSTFHPSPGTETPINLTFHPSPHEKTHKNRILLYLCNINHIKIN